MSELRIALTISGAVSLGAYEGGVLAALLVAAQSLHEQGRPSPIRIDAIGGASAGSITALLTARTVLAGLDPVWVMKQSWVDQPSIASLRTKDPHSPLSVEQVRSSARQLIDPLPEHRKEKTQAASVRLVMALASIRGLNYRFGRLRGPPLEASTYLDWKEFTFHPSSTVDDYIAPEKRSALDYALASGANALGFPPRLIRRAEDNDEYVDAGVINLPPDWQFWYTDGGTVNNEPLGRTFDLSNKIDNETPLGPGDRRVHLLIHPHPTAPPASGDAAWARPEVQPAWTMMLARGFQLQTTQSLFEDLRHAEKTNSRIHWTAQLVEVLEGVLPDDDATRAALLASLASMRGQKNALAARTPNAIDAAPAVESSDASLSLRRLLEENITIATGLHGKSPVAVEAISPLLLPEANIPDPSTGRTKTVEELLAGEFLHHFGGFVDVKLRLSDFALGYRSGLVWLKDGLERHGLDHVRAEAAYEAASRRRDAAWDEGLGDASMRHLPGSPLEQRRDRREVRRLFRHIGRVALHEGFWHGFLRKKPSIFRP